MHVTILYFVVEGKETKKEELLCTSEERTKFLMIGIWLDHTFFTHEA